MPSKVAMVGLALRIPTSPSNIPISLTALRGVLL